MTVTLTKYPAPLLNKIGSYVCQAVIYIQQQQPELLLDKYRSISWRDSSNQLRLKAKLIELISNAQDWQSLVSQIEIFIQTLLVQNATNTPVLIKLQEKIRHLNPNLSESQNSNQEKNLTATTKESNNTKNNQNFSNNKQEISSNKTTQKESLPIQNELKSSEKLQKVNSNELPQTENVSATKELKSSNQPEKALSNESPEKEHLPVKAELENSENPENISAQNEKLVKQPVNQDHKDKVITALLLDAENIKITSETEQFLTNICTNPIQLKIAFANWHSMAQKDIEFHNRGYDLIHVPHSENSTDEKMIAFGSTIDEYSPKAKEVFLCCSPKVMNQLCNHLQKKGLTVYQVSQQLSNVTILNGKTNETQTHLILPSMETLLCQIKNIILEQEAHTSNQWVKLSKICKLFKDKHSFGINKVVSHHLPGKNVKNIFVNQPEFVIHQIPEHPEVYITLFKMPTQEDLDINQSSTTDDT